jgi:tetratricopeptide (TPR) repeat protein
MKLPALTLLAALLALPVTVPHADAPAGDEREAAVYDAFRQEFDAGRYDAALPLAQELVTLMEADPTAVDQLPTAYNNLGVTQFRSGDTSGAEASFNHALELLERSQGIASRRLVSPLAGLGAVYAAENQHARAVDVLQRAVGITRRADGLFNLQQLDLLDAVVKSYEALGAYDAVEREHRYALQVVQQQYGSDDPRTLPAAIQLAQWYEKTGRYAAARALWARTAEIGAREDGGRNAATINGLLGITRTHRLQYVRDPESLAQGPAIDPFTGQPDPLAGASSRFAPVRLERDGDAAARKALEILDGTPSPPRALLAGTLLELGDWYTTAHAPERALPCYERAWPLLQEGLRPGESNPLAAPRPMHYRPPVAAFRNRLRPDVRTVARSMQFSLAVAATGEVTGVATVSSEAQDGQTGQVQDALKKAWFSPRFEDGHAVATADFPFVEHWYDIAPPEPEAPAAPAATPPPEGKAAGS